MLQSQRHLRPVAVVLMEVTPDRHARQATLPLKVGRVEKQASSELFGEGMSASLPHSCPPLTLNGYPSEMHFHESRYRRLGFRCRQSGFGETRQCNAIEPRMDFGDPEWWVRQEFWTRMDCDKSNSDQAQFCLIGQTDCNFESDLVMGPTAQ